MKVLVVCSYNSGQVKTFISEQVKSIRDLGIETAYFLIKGKGIRGYLKNLSAFKRKINSFKPDLIHAHYGLSGLLATFQQKVPVITTFHGSDINIRKVRILSQVAMKRSIHSIFVSKKLAERASAKSKFSILPCGIDLEIFKPIENSEARRVMDFSFDEKIVLFSGAFSNKVKNSPLAVKALEQIDKNIRLIELKDYSRDQVNYLLNACDVALLTSFSEGSPNFIKEAMACNCPIVSTNVGDICELLGKTEGCYLTTFNTHDVTAKLKMAFSFASQHPKGTCGRKRIIELGIESNIVAQRLTDIYLQINDKRQYHDPK